MQCWFLIRLLLIVFWKDTKHLSAHANELLTAIVQGLHNEEKNSHVKLAAANAMLNSIEFSKANFDETVISACSIWNTTRTDSRVS